MRRNHLVLFLVFVFPLLLSAQSEGYYIVASKKLKQSVNESDLKNIFLGYKKYWPNGERIKAFHIDTSTEGFKSFLKKHLGMESGQYNSYWRRKLFSGRGYPPRKSSSNQEIIQSIKGSSNAIGVLSQLPEGDEVQVLNF